MTHPGGKKFKKENFCHFHMEVDFPRGLERLHPSM